jgi:glutathione S-transferase
MYVQYCPSLFPLNPKNPRTPNLNASSGTSEELNIDYNLTHNYRNQSSHPTTPFRSPPFLLATGPYGKAPLLITGSKDGIRYIPESAAIATYLIPTFDNEDKFGLRDGDWIRDEVLCSIISTNPNRATGMILVMDFGIVKNRASNTFDRPELRSILKDLERELKEAPAGGWFVGPRPGSADILLEFPMSTVKHRNWVDLKSEFPPLGPCLKKVYGRDAWKRSLEKGNGYD